jgi:DNA invertase Pin-like site-specific DNA recombinase
MSKIFGYCRVSTGLQTTENQRKEILDYAYSKNLKVDTIIEVTISSRKNSIDREIDETISKLNRGDTLIVTKLDRLGRSTIEVLKIIEELKEKGIVLQIIKDNITVDVNDTNPINTMLLTLLSGFAQMERDFISERTKSALAQRKSQGIKLGRKKGQIVKSKFDEHKDKIEELISYKVPISKIVELIGVGTRQSLHTYINSRGIRIK